MEMTWTIPVAIIVAGATYAIFARYFAYKERTSARNSGADAEQQAGKK